MFVLFGVDGFCFLSRALLGFKIAIFIGFQKSLGVHRAWALFCRFYAFEANGVPSMGFCTRGYVHTGSYLYSS